MQRFMGWIKRNVAVVVALDVILSLVLFGVIQIQQSKADCYDHIFDQAVSQHPPPRAVLEAEARGCAGVK